MSEFVIVTDSSCDLFPEYLKKEEIYAISLSFSLEDVVYKSNDGRLTEKEFYNIMRKGSMPVTAQINVNDATTELEAILQKNVDILYISFSSALSGSCNSVRIAANELMEKYPQRRLVVVDSLAASMGQGLLVYKANQLKTQGKSMDEIIEWCEANKLKVCHYFTVDDLNHLHRGGRVSKASAVVGSMLGIKPVLHVDNEGRLIPVSKVRGRKQSLTELVNLMEKTFIKEENDLVMISHGDCIEDAEFVADLVQKRFGLGKPLINYVGSIIGAHSGPGTVALFFIGKER